MFVTRAAVYLSTKQMFFKFMNKVYFSIKPLNLAGFGDQIGTQFTRLYAIGDALGLKYIYTPISYPRSTTPLWLLVCKRIFFFCRCKILFSNADNVFVKLASRVLDILEHVFLKFSVKQKDESLSKFIGLSSYKSESHKKLNFKDIYIEELLDKGLVTLNEIKTHLKLDSSGSKDTNEVLRLCWSVKSYDYLETIDKIFQKESIKYEHALSPFLREAFWKKKNKDARPTPDNKTLVVHIRCGDSTVVNLEARKFTINGSAILTAEELDNILKIDPNRIPVELYQYERPFFELSNSAKNKNHKVIVLSDGYEETYYTFVRALLNHNNHIRLSRDEKRILKHKIKNLNEDFNRFKTSDNTNLIIGENKKNLFKSIDALVDADIILFGCGGFAYNTNTMFRQKETLIVHVNDKN